MRFSQREKITKSEAREKAIAFLETNNFFGLDRESVEHGKELNEIISRATDEFTLIREISAALLKFENEAQHIAAAKAKKEKAKKENKKHEPVNIKMVSVAFVKDEDLTVGEFIAELTERYSKAGLLDVKLSEIRTEDSSLSAVIKLNETGMKTFAIGYDEYTCCEYVDMILEDSALNQEDPQVATPGIPDGAVAFQTLTPEELLRTIFGGAPIPMAIIKK
ncbi:MAG: hypothetical protein ACRCXX_13640 [Cetobacterium sp.]|uniref:hypothetical protein n=1 Tax=Cetobacterium sp. TaxID=2071632 RepID=UPI003F2F378C